MNQNGRTCRPRTARNDTDIHINIPAYSSPAPLCRDPESRQKARYIDKLSRKLFPLAFLSFNLIYWLSYILSWHHRMCEIRHSVHLHVQTIIVLCNHACSELEAAKCTWKWLQGPFWIMMALWWYRKCEGGQNVEITSDQSNRTFSNSSASLADHSRIWRITHEFNNHLRA